MEKYLNTSELLLVEAARWEELRPLRQPPYRNALFLVEQPASAASSPPPSGSPSPPSTWTSRRKSERVVGGTTLIQQPTLFQMPKRGFIEVEEGFPRPQILERKPASLPSAISPKSSQLVPRWQARRTSGSETVRGACSSRRSSAHLVQPMCFGREDEQ